MILKVRLRAGLPVIRTMICCSAIILVISTIAGVDMFFLYSDQDGLTRTSRTT